MDEQDGPRRPRGRPRSSSVDEALNDAARDEFIESGYAGMSMESIARRAQVSKVSLYRRWPSKLAVTADVLSQLGHQSMVSDCGGIVADVRSLLTSSMGLGTSQARLVFRTLGEMSNDPELSELYRTHLLEPRIAQLRGLVERARDRGELVEDLDTDVACALIAGPLFAYQLLLLTGADTGPPDLADRYARAILRGIARDAASG